MEGNELVYQKEVSRMKEGIEISTQSHLDFWGELLEDRPDVNKLEKEGQKLKKSHEKLEVIWKRMKEETVGGGGAVGGLYGQYLLQVV